MYNKIIKDIRNYNQISIFKIRYRKLINKYTLFLELQRDKQRKTFNIENCFIFGKPSTYSHDKNMVIKASQIQKAYDIQYEIRKDTLFTQAKLNEGDVLSFFESMRDAKETKPTRKSWSNAIKLFKKFDNGRTTFKDIDLIFCEKFKSFLLQQVSENSTATYFSIFKAMLNQAIKYNIIVKNPARFVSTPKKRVDREYLLFEEVKLLATTESKHPHITNGFLFSCFTGLRISDIKELKWSNVTNNTLEYTQQKTGIIQKIKINKSAMEILEEQKRIARGKIIFKLPKSNSNSNKHLKDWVIQSGITKHITFHCSRHTFATLCLTSDIDIYTVSKLLGHTDIKNTQIYAKLIDKKKDEAIDKLPTL
jgi:integrase